MLNIHKFKTAITIFLFVFSTIFLMGIWGCQQKKNQPEKIITKPEVATKAPDTTQKVITKPKSSIPQLEGTWTGKFDLRKATLTITKQTGENFDGKMTINYRIPLKQKVSGHIDEKDMTITMKDLLHSRYQGKYSAKLSKDKMIIKGKFTLNSNGKKYNFQFNRK